jgi:hypothetical protein
VQVKDLGVVEAESCTTNPACLLVYVAGAVLSYLFSNHLQKLVLLAQYYRGKVGKERSASMTTDTRWVDVSAGIQAHTGVTSQWPLLSPRNPELLPAWARRWFGSSHCLQRHPVS